MGIYNDDLIKRAIKAKEANDMVTYRVIAKSVKESQDACGHPQGFLRMEALRFDTFDGKYKQGQTAQFCAGCSYVVNVLDEDP